MAQDSRRHSHSRFGSFAFEGKTAKLVKRIAAWRLPEEAVVIGTSLLVGVGTGLAATALIWLIAQVQFVLFWMRATTNPTVGRLVIMALAGLIVGWIAAQWEPAVRGSGIPDVIEAVALRGGEIRARVPPLKMLCTALTIGAGGSAGREGPIVQIGSALGSLVGRTLHVGSQRVRTLVACGAAAGIAASFNAPIAGSIFALEVILGNFNVRSFGAVVISAVAGGVVSRVFLTTQPAFVVPAYPLHHLGELPIYVALGAFSALVAVLFIVVREWIGALFQRLPISSVVRPMLGMLLTALLGLWMVDIYGSGLDIIGVTLASHLNLTVYAMAALFLLKILATSLTLGSGNAGGVFAPSLFMGAMLGGMVGKTAHAWWPQVAANPEAYAIVGMAAVFAGATRTPVTAVLIVFEMSNDYQLILPLMLATALATVLADYLSRETLYTQVLKARGITIQGGRDVDILDSVLVDEVMARNIHTIVCGMNLVELSELFSQTHSHGFIMLDTEGQLGGVVTITDLDRAIAQNRPRSTTALDIGTPWEHLVTAYPDETIGEALGRMGVRGFGRLPVVARSDPRHVVGLVRRQDIVRAYNIALTRRAELQHRAKRAQLRNVDNTEFVDLVLSPADRAVGKTIQQIGADLPRECILISIRRGGKVLIPHGNTVLQSGDDVTAFIASQDFEQLRHCLQG